MTKIKVWHPNKGKGPYEHVSKLFSCFSILLLTLISVNKVPRSVLVHLQKVKFNPHFSVIFRSNTDHVNLFKKENSCQSSSVSLITKYHPPPPSLNTFHSISFTNIKFALRIQPLSTIKSRKTSFKPTTLLQLEQTCHLHAVFKLVCKHRSTLKQYLTAPVFYFIKIKTDTTNYFFYTINSHFNTLTWEGRLGDCWNNPEKWKYCLRSFRKSTGCTMACVVMWLTKWKLYWSCDNNFAAISFSTYHSSGFRKLLQNWLW